MQTDYKFHELSLYSNDNVGRLRFQDGKGTGLGPGFGQYQRPYVFPNYTLLIMVPVTSLALDGHLLMVKKNLMMKKKPVKMPMLN